ncbi:MAG TPA: ParB/RepB/Spo0J family partition protein [Accumulibacter sp.]|nr:ParB/RepB/Spo0J family partition protein [Accumulibacter sp.]
MKMKGLGRGLDALLADSDSQHKEQQRTLPVDRLQPGKYQPRTRMDPASLEELAASIRAQGLMQPVLVRPIGDERYEIVAGERRWRAAQMAGLSELSTLVREIPDEAALAMALIENIQREDLNPLEEALGLQRLIDEFAMTHQQAADAVGRSRPAASNLLRLLQLAPPVQDLLMNGEIDMGHARALLPLSGALQVQSAQRVVQKGLSVRETERLVQFALRPAKEHQPSKPDRDMLRLQEELADLLGAQVAIRANRRGAGKVMIEFGDLDQLDGILQRLRH